MVDETKTPVASREELTQGLQLVDALIARLQEMRDITVALLARPGEDEVVMTHRESLRMERLREEIGELTA